MRGAISRERFAGALCPTNHHQETRTAKGKMSMEKLRPAGASTPNGPVNSSYNSAESYLAKISATPYSVKLPTGQKRIVCDLVARIRIARRAEDVW